MKQIIITLSILCMGIGGWAQTNPNIARLVDEAYSIEGSNVKYFCSYDGYYHEIVNLFLQPDPEKKSPLFANDSIRHLTDSIIRLHNQAARPIYDAIRKTCQSLAQNAVESHLWEYHHNGTDSIKYAIFVQKGNNSVPKGVSKYALNDFFHTDLSYYHTLVSQEARKLVSQESLKYEYYTWERKNRQDYPNGYWPLKGWGQLDYCYDVDTVMGEIKHFDKEGYRSMIENLLNNTMQVTSRPLYFSHDSICPISPNDINMVFYVRPASQKGKYDEKTKQWTITTIRPQSESHGILYTMHSKELADSLLQQIISSTKSYLKEHPHIRYKFYPKVRYEEALSPVFTGENGTGAVEDYRIFVHHDQRGEYHILTFDTKGELWIPLAWPELKTWKNGEATYYSRKMSELELTIYTRNREQEKSIKLCSGNYSRIK